MATKTQRFTTTNGGSNGVYDRRSGYCAETKIYHSLRPPVPLPPETAPLSVADYVFSLLYAAADAPLDTIPVLFDSSTGAFLSSSDLLLRVHNLVTALRRRPLTVGDVALVLSPPSMEVPVLYLALLSLGVVVSPANPLATVSELSHIIKLANPVVIFTVSSIAHKLAEFSLPIVLLDSPEFSSMIHHRNPSDTADRIRFNVSQSDSAAILFSSGTTGKVKGVELTHRNIIALIAGMYHLRSDKIAAARPVCLLTLPLFHIFGLFSFLRAVALAETVVMMERFDFEKALKAVEKYRVTYMPVSPPLVVALAKSELVAKYDLSSLELLGCGGAPLGKEAAERFKSRFPNVEIVQGYGLTETGGGASRTLGPEETERYGSVGRLAELMEAKIVDPSTGEGLPPGQQGELWLRGPTVMKGYVGDKEATAATLDKEGWLKTGDLCYFDSDGCLCIVDRLKELIKYKAYQVPPAELEHILLSHPEIADAAVVPWPDEEAGEIPMAFVVRKPGSNVSASQIMDYVAKQVAPYKKIRRVSFINAIPKNPSGKILRRELLNQAALGASAKL